MTIAHDTQTVATAYASTGTQTTSHAGSANTKAAVVLIAQNGTATDEVSGVTYGGVAMKRLDSNSESTEAGRTYTYYLLNPPTGTQDVAMTTTASTNKQLMVATMTGDKFKTIKLAGALPCSFFGTSASVANPSWNITGLVAGTKLEAYEVIHSGLTTMTNTPATGWTLISSTDLGAQGRGFARQSVASQSGTTLASGWTAATADDFVGQSVAFYEDDNLVNLLDGPPTVLNNEASTFENGTVGGWAGNTFFGGASPDTVANSAVRAHSGTKSILATHVTDGTKIGDACFYVTGLVNGQRYQFSAWVWVPTGSNDVRLEAVFLGSSAYTSLKDQWVNLTCEFQADSQGVAFIAVVVNQAVTGQQVWIDDATGVVVFPTGTLTTVLDGATALMSGTVGTNDATGTLATTLDNVTAVVTAVETFSGPLATTLDNSTTSVSGVVANPVSGTLATTLDDAVAAVVGAETFTGTLTSTLDGGTFAGSGSETMTGTLATTLDDVVAAVSGAETFTGALAATLADAVLAGSGVETISGPLASTLDDVVLAGSGTVANPVTGTLAATLDDSVLSGSGSETMSGTLSTTLDGAIASVSGVVANPVSGTLSTTLDNVVFDASGAAGTPPVDGTLATTLDGVTLAASGIEIFSGTWVTTLADAVLAGSGEEAFTGTMSTTLDDSTVSGSGNVSGVPIEGTLATTLAGVVFVAFGTCTGGDLPLSKIPGAALRVPSPASTMRLRTMGSTATVPNPQRAQLTTPNPKAELK